MRTWRMVVGSEYRSIGVVSDLSVFGDEWKFYRLVHGGFIKESNALTITEVTPLDVVMFKRFIGICE